MFTGIITHQGILKDKRGPKFIIETDLSLIKKIEKGTSVSINGACLTVLEMPKQKTFTVEIMPETQKKTMLGKLISGDIVNLELPTTSDTLLSGHLVQGHIDSIGTISDIEKKGNSRILTITIPKEITKYIVEKGSIAVNGIALTVINQIELSFTVGIIPFTWENTMLHDAKVGDPVNIETDILAKYIEKLLKKS